jgi:hypothetical protein
MSDKEPTNEEVLAMEPIDLLAYMGTDGQKWTRGFLLHTDLANAGPDFQATVNSWFANAIEFGKTAGMNSALEEMRHSADNLRIDFSEVYVPAFAIELAYHTGWSRGERRGVEKIATGE